MKPTDDNEKPKIQDRRSGTGSKDVPAKPAVPHDPVLDLPTDYSKNQNRLANVRWAPGEDPRTDELNHNGYKDYKLEVLEHPVADVDPYADIHGTPTGVGCWSCPGGKYLIIAERTSQEVGDTLDEVVWARKMNRPVDPEKVPDVLKLFCPNCRSVMEMRKEIVLEMMAKAVASGDR